MTATSAADPAADDTTETGRAGNTTEASIYARPIIPTVRTTADPIAGRPEDRAFVLVRERMVRMYTGPLRLLRALMVSGTCVALSFGAHLVGAGSGMLMLSLVAVMGLVMTTVLLTLVLAALSGQRWTLGRSMVVLAVGQVVLNSIFTVMLSSHHAQSPASLGTGVSMAFAHAVAALLIGTVIAANDAALDTYFCLASSLAGSGIGVLAPWRLTSLISAANPVATVRAAGRDQQFAHWQRPGILTDLVVLQCLSRRGPPALALAP